MDKTERIKLILNVTAVVVFLIVFIFLGRFFLNDGFECVDDPYIYATSRMAEKLDGSITCTCIVNSIPQQKYVFTEKEFNPQYNQNTLKLNLSSFN